MKYSEIKNSFENIAETNNIEGTAISTIISSLSYAVYNNQVMGINLLKETNLLTSTVLNSIITHAAARGYSVYRGHNIVYTISGINPVQNTVVKKYDLFLNIEGYELRYNADYELLRDTAPNPRGTTIQVILCQKGGYKGVTKRSNKYGTVVSQPNISQSLIIFNADNEEYTVHNSYEDYLKDNVSDNKIIVTTGTSYSVTINNPSKSEDDLYSIRYLEYSDYVNLDISELDKKIKDFDILDSFGVNTNNSFIPREEDLDLLKYKIQNSYKSSFLVKSNTDLEFVVRDYFKGTVIGVNIIKNDSGVRIFYRTFNGVDLPNDSITDFKNYLQKAYYIYDSISMQNTDPRNYDLNIIVYYKDNVSIATKYVTSILDEYEEKIGLSFNPYFLLGKLNDSEFITSINSSSLNTTTIQLLDNEYLKFSRNINYVNYKSV